VAADGPLAERVMDRVVFKNIQNSGRSFFRLLLAFADGTAYKAFQKNILYHNAYMRMVAMPFSSQTLDGIPKEFLIHQKTGSDNPKSGPSVSAKTEDLLFILTLLLFLRDEPLFMESESV
jgi:hypothetical protein